MKSRSTIMVCAATMFGFLVGVVSTHQTAVRAQSGIQVYVVKRDAFDMAKKGPTLIPGSAIVGFSCSSWGAIRASLRTAIPRIPSRG
jgi:hypothetical protein